MTNFRVRIAKDKASLIVDLVSANHTTGPFSTYADVIIFAAMLGYQNRRRIAIVNPSKAEPGPISADIFTSRGYDPVIRLISMVTTDNINIISSHQPEFEEQRYQLIEEYANGGLEILQTELRGAVDYTDRLLLLLSTNTQSSTVDGAEFDLSKFLN